MSVFLFVQQFVGGLTPGAVGVWVVAIGLLLKWSGEWRAWRKLPLDVQQANREGFSAQVDLLQRQLAASDEENRRTRAEIAGCREELQTVRDQFDEYRNERYAEEQKLRGVIAKLERELSLLRKKLTDIALRAVRGEMTKEDAQELHGIAVFFQGRETSGE